MSSTPQGRFPTGSPLVCHSHVNSTASSDPGATEAHGHIAAMGPGVRGKASDSVSEARQLTPRPAVQPAGRDVNRGQAYRAPPSWWFVMDS